ncbi:hypothetical protein CJD35_06540 [Sphingobium xenophagum]|uniref:AB hydrolase-1 domain-containing protein n=1 Tax=Sphingobium xenophagum TaxID=121428 RepID=A0A249MS01_SPHXE|nr:hypothetical protein CJD35_06540 [Sphingobium xenophagum]
MSWLARIGARIYRSDRAAGVSGSVRGRAEDGFDVIVPALPGYGYSSRPPAPLGPRATAALFNRLMTGCLGYPRYMAQGGDWGSAVTAWMAHDFPDQIIGLHLNMAIVLSSHVQEIEDGRDYLAHKQAIWAREGGYAIQQGTRPQSLAFAMADSPVGMMAWILDKFNCWSDQSEPDLFKRFPIDLLIGNVMLYLVTDSFATSTWMYKGFRNEASDRLPPNGKINVPTAFAAFPDPVFVPPPRAILEQAYNLCRLTPMERGGHFAAMEAPGPFAQDVTLFGRRIDFS